LTEIDQSMIDQLVATAEADTPESKIAKLEKEVETLKGAIKRLLMDIREAMNNLENPFQSLQNLAQVINKPLQPQPVQVIPTPPPKEEEKEEEEKEGKKEEKEEKKVEEKVEEKKEEKKEEFERKVEEEVEKKEVEKEEEDVVKEVEEVDNVFQAPKLVVKEEEKKIEEVMPKRMSVLTFYSMMEWVRRMLEKYDMNTIKELLDLFETAGYISEELKDFTSKMVDIVSVVGDGLDELLIDLYKLHKTVNPNDRSMDSELLKILLEKRGDLR